MDLRPSCSFDEIFQYLRLALSHAYFMHGLQLTTAGRGPLYAERENRRGTDAGAGHL